MNEQLCFSKRTLCIGILLLINLNLFPQGCFINITHPTKDTTICLGDSVYLRSKGSCSFLMNNDFSSQTIGPGWSSTSANPVFNNPCGNGPNGYHMWVGTTASANRTLETNAYDISVGGCHVDWWMRYGRVQGYGNCEDPDASNEGVHLQYSVNNGASWVDFTGSSSPIGLNSTTGPYTTVTTTHGSGGYWAPVSSQASQSNNTNYYWHQYSSQVPVSAVTSSTKFRWAQLATSNAGYDAWGIDEVQIKCNNFVQFVFWSHGPNVFNPAKAVKPTVTTSYYVMIMDDQGNAETDTVTIYVTPTPEPDLGADTTICFKTGDSLGLYPGSGFNSFTWNTLSTDSTIYITNSGIYSVSVQNGNCIGNDSIVLSLIPPPNADAGPDQTICYGDTTMLSANILSGVDYQWSSGDTNAITYVSPFDDQLYIVKISVDSTCYSFDSVFVEVNALPIADAGSDIGVCLGDSVFLTATGGAHYEWSTGDNVAGIWVRPIRDTLFGVTVTDSKGCIDSDEMNMLVYPLPLVEIISGPDTICYGDSAVYEVIGADQYQWSTGDIGSIIYLNPIGNGLIVVAGTDVNGCINTDCHELIVDDCTTFFVPNAFTPGGKNPEFGPFGDFSGITKYEFIIYDRWGKVVFHTKDKYKRWDGTQYGKRMPLGVYTYYISFTSPYNKGFEKAGTVTLLR